MPTNGVSEWVFPSLAGIYDQHIDEELFEVIIMDNGDDKEFEKKIKDYSANHSNLWYFHTDKPLFLSEPESYRKASGELIKFINHRNILTPGSLQYLIDFVNKYRSEKPVVYFTNGSTAIKHAVSEFDSFGKFVLGLGYFSSWSSGMAVWKSDMEQFASDDHEFNYLFPHTDILFCRRDASRYIIDGTYLWDEQKQGKKPKGNYDLFYAFAVEYPGIIEKLVKSGDMDMKDFLSFKSELRNFLSDLYFDYVFLKKYCSYDLSNYKQSLSVYYSEREILLNYFTKKIRKIPNAIGHMLKRRKR